MAIAMAMLADLAEVVIGVDTHKHTHTAAIVAAATGAVLAQRTVAADADGYQTLQTLAEQHPGRRVWTLEATGGFGAGLTRALHAAGSRWGLGRGAGAAQAARAPPRRQVRLAGCRACRS
jgi:hypothetical protein